MLLLKFTVFINVDIIRSNVYLSDYVLPKNFNNLAFLPVDLKHTDIRAVHTKLDIHRCLYLGVLQILFLYSISIYLLQDSANGIFTIHGLCINLLSDCATNIINIPGYPSTLLSNRATYIVAISGLSI